MDRLKYPDLPPFLPLSRARLHQLWDFLFKVPPDPTIAAAIELHANYPISQPVSVRGEVRPPDEEPAADKIAVCNQPAPRRSK